MKSNRPVALITGAAQHLGADIARALHRAQYNVVIHYRHAQAQARVLHDQLNALRINSASILSADFTLPDVFTTLVTQAQTKWQRLDVLINNASEYFPTPVGETTEQQWEDLLASNLKAPYFLSQAAIPYLGQANGCIINISDINAYRPLANYPVYSIAKAGLNTLTAALAQELGPSIRVNAIAPGPILWPAREDTLGDTTTQKIIAQTVLKRKGRPTDVTAAVLFLIRQVYITGQVLNIDGGKSIIF